MAAKEDKKLIHSFPPSADSDAEILILGSMPGAESLRMQQYYAFSGNIFWRMTGEILSFDPALPYHRRLEELRKNKIALWDSVFRCVRPGSMDSDIREVVPNDFVILFQKCENIRRILFNGQTAFKLFKRYADKSTMPSGIEQLVMPSTSPAYASKKYVDKLCEWQCAINL